MAIVGLWARFHSTHDPGHPHQQVQSSAPPMATVVNHPDHIKRSEATEPSPSTKISALPIDIQEIVFMEEGEEDPVVYGTVGRYGCAEVGCPVRAPSKRLIGHHSMMNHQGHGVKCCGTNFVDKESWLSHYEQFHGPPPTVTTLHDALDPTTPKQKKSGRINTVKCPICSKSLACASLRSHLTNPAIHGLKQAQMSVLRTECGICGEEFHLTSTNIIKSHCQRPV